MQSCPTAVDDALPVAQQLMLEPAVPNPFNPNTQLSFELDRSQDLRLAIYDARGREITVLTEGFHNAGRHTVTWTGFDRSGRRAPAGVYLARLVSADHVDTRKLTMVK